jgi:hypothetical protein
MKDAYNTLDSHNSIQNPEKSIQENLEAGVSSSGVGQYLSNKLGTYTASARNRIDSSRSTLVPAVMKASGLTGSQINSEAELRQFLKSLTDPTNDIKSVREQLKTLDKLYGTGNVFKEEIKQPSVKSGVKFLGFE